MPEDHLGYEDAGATACDELAASDRDKLFQHRGAHRRADARMRHYDAILAELQFINRLRTFLAATGVGEPRALADVVDNILEEAQHAMLGNLLWLVNDVRLDHRSAR